MGDLENLESRFDEAMMGIYEHALNECGYNAKRFLQMLQEHRGLQTARILLHNPKVSEGYTALWERGRLDLTVESLILKPEWQPLFSDQELKTAQERLADYGFRIINAAK
jgi:hypothetical protein